MLVVLHQERSSAGRIGRLLEAKGYALDARRPRFGDPLPETLAEHAGAVVFGGPMSANDPEPWLATETDWLAVPLREGRPLLGVCLGAQMLARHLGGAVAPRPDGVVEIGYYPLRPTPAGEALAARAGAPWPPQVYHWHREGLSAPACCALLARGDAFPEQAFSYGSAVGVQFHPEVTYAMACAWTTRAAARLAQPGAQPARLHLEGRLRHDAAVAAWLGPFLDGWLAGWPEATSARIAPARAKAGRAAAGRGLGSG